MRLYSFAPFPMEFCVYYLVTPIEKKMNITVTHAWIVVFIPYLPLSTQKAKLYFLQICFALKWIFRYLKPLDSINLEYKVIKFIEKKYLPQKRRPLLV